MIEDYPLGFIFRNLSDPYGLSPNPPAIPTPSRRPLFARLFGPFEVPELGILTTSPGATPNVQTAHRSAGLLPKIYGSTFRLEEYMRVSSWIIGCAAHFILLGVTLSLLVPPIRFVAKKYLAQPGSGPSDTSNENNSLEMRALGTAIDPQTGTERKAMSRFMYNQHTYYMSGALMVEAAMAILTNEPKVKERFNGGGMLTAACLAETTNLLDRLRGVGFELEVEDVE